MSGTSSAICFAGFRSFRTCFWWLPTVKETDVRFQLPGRQDVRFGLSGISNERVRVKYVPASPGKGGATP